MGGGDRYSSVQKGQTPMRSGYTVCISAKRSTGTVELANMGGGDRYPLLQKGQPPYAVGMQYAVGTMCTVFISAKRSYGWWGPLPFSAKKSKPMQWVLLGCGGYGWYPPTGGTPQLYEMCFPIYVP